MELQLGGLTGFFREGRVSDALEAESAACEAVEVGGDELWCFHQQFEVQTMLSMPAAAAQPVRSGRLTSCPPGSVLVWSCFILIF